MLADQKIDELSLTRLSVSEARRSPSMSDQQASSRVLD